MVIVAVFVQLLAPVDVTVYVVVTLGFTVTEAALRFPGFQVYVRPDPDAVSVVEPPGQIELGLAEAVTVGEFSTTTVCEELFNEQGEEGVKREPKLVTLILA